jgi:hypothetical protein
MMQVSKKIPFEDENVLWGVRGLYILSNLIIVGVYLYIQSKINAKKGTRQLLKAHCVANAFIRYDHPEICRARPNGVR